MLRPQRTLNLRVRYFLGNSITHLTLIFRKVQSTNFANNSLPPPQRLLRFKCFLTSCFLNQHDLWYAFSCFLTADIIIQTPQFQNFSYMMFAKTNIRSTTQITIRFKTETLDGILFYVSHEEQSTTGDFLSIILHNG